MDTELELAGKVTMLMYIEFTSKITLEQYFDILDDLKQIIHSNVSYDFIRDLEFDEDLDTLGYYENTEGNSTAYQFWFNVIAHGYMEEEDFRVRRRLISLNLKEVKRIINEKYGAGTKVYSNKIKDSDFKIKNKTISEKGLYY